MSKTTTNFNLIKPELTDPADITFMNENWDKIDQSMVYMLNQIAVYYGGDSNKSADDLTDPFALIPINSTLNGELFNLISGTFAYVITLFYGGVSKENRRMQLAFSYNGSSPKMAHRVHTTSGWLPWEKIVDHTYLSNLVDTLYGEHNSHIGFKTYNSLSDIGLTVGNETIHDIGDKLPDLSTLTYSVIAGNAAIYPSQYGICQVTKISSSRIQFEFTDTSGKYWSAFYSITSNGNSWSDWVDAPTKDHEHTAGDITSGTLSSSRLPTVPVSKGGTGKTSVTSGSFLVGNGTNAMTEKTPAEVLSAIGAAASSHNHAASNITSGTLSVARGGTGKASFTANRIIYPSASTTITQLAFPTVAGSVLRQGTSGAPYWTSLTDLMTAMGGPRVEFKIRTGTGGSNEANACSLTFSFEPKAVLWLGMHTGTSSFVNKLLSLEVPFEFADRLTTSYAAHRGFCPDDSTTYTNYMYAKKSSDGKTWYWYNTKGEEYQLNKSGYKYYFVAIG